MMLREYISFWQETYDRHRSRPTTYAAHNYVFKTITIKHLTGNVLSLIPFALPPHEEQSRIVEKLNQVFDLLNSILCD